MLVVVILVPVILAFGIRYGFKRRDKLRQQREEHYAKYGHKRLRRGSSVASSPSMAGQDGGTSTVNPLSADDDDRSASLLNDVEAHADAVSDVFARRSFTIDFEFENLGLNLKSSGRSVLAGVTGKISSSRVTAVMGPSGAGKSTFVTTLAGKSYYGDTTGVIKINGIARPLTDFKRVVGFVPQEDIMMRDLSVKENIWFSARTRLPADWNLERKKRYRDATLQMLGLWDIRHSIIGDENTRGISGGQRKRVNIGIEMVANPTVLFLDEPTSGLDSTSSLEVCAALRKIADIGLTIVTVIHQPRYEIFCAFHDVLLLGKGGRAVYLGPSGDALDYFARKGFDCPPRVNPPDFMMDVIAGDLTDEMRQSHPDFKPSDLFDMWIEESKRSDVGGVSKAAASGAASPAQKIRDSSLYDAEQEAIHRRQAPPRALVLLYMLRSFVQQSRHLLDVCVDNALLLLSAAFMAFININQAWVTLPAPLNLGCYNGTAGDHVENQCGLQAAGGRLAEFGAKNNILIRAQMTCLAVGLCTCAAAIKTFGRERVVYFREASGLEQPWQSLSYFVGKDLAAAPQMLIGPFLFGFFSQVISGAQGSLGGLYVILLGITFASYAVGYLVAVVTPASLSQLVGIFWIFSLSAFNGVQPTIPELHESGWPILSWRIEWFSFLTPAVEAFYVNEAIQWEGVARSADIDIKEFMRNTFDFAVDNYSRDVALLFAWGFFLRIAGAVAMALKDRNKKL